MPNEQTQEQANTLRQQAETVRVLCDVGYDKDAVVMAVTANDLTKLTGS
jgi:hypothetical protein